MSPGAAGHVHGVLQDHRRGPGRAHRPHVRLPAGGVAHLQLLAVAVGGRAHRQRHPAGHRPQAGRVRGARIGSGSVRQDIDP